jgi:electron transfer flavoprotein alpha subunit
MVEVDKEKCCGCGNCVEVCPFGILEIKDGKVNVKDSSECKKCGACVIACPDKALKIKD